MAGLVELRQYKIILADDGLRVLVTPRDGIVPDQIAQRIEAMLRAKLLEAGVADPRLKVEIMPELPRDQGHGAKFTLIESRTSTTR